MRRIVILPIVALAIAGCQRKAETSSPAADVAFAPPPAAMAQLRAPKLKEPEPADTAADATAAAPDVAAAAADAEPADTTVRVAAGPPQLAYSYTYGLRLPHTRVDELRRKHEAACVQAGYKVCQVVSSSVTNGANDDVEAALEIRAAPGWLKPFRDGLEGQARDLGGKVEKAEVSSEDLSREIVDTDAQLRAKTTLRDRLQALLAGHPGKVGDLLAVERELARVQGEIDSAQSELAVMRGRVAMSDVTLAYRSGDVLGASVRSPLSASFRAFFANIAQSLAAMVDLLAVLLPWALVLGVLAWVFRKRLPNVRWPFRRKDPPPAA